MDRRTLTELYGLDASVTSNPRDTVDESEQHDFDTYPLELADAAERYMAEDALNEACTVTLGREDVSRVVWALRTARDGMFDRTDPGFRRYTDLIARIQEAAE